MTTKTWLVREIAKEGFRFAKLHRDKWWEGVNQCPYGPGVPGNDKANAWYRGWWFFFYTIKPMIPLFPSPQENERSELSGNAQESS